MISSLSPEQHPCLIHGYHSPTPWSNDGHHVVPQAWTQRLKLPESWIAPLCPTGHDVVHRAITAQIAGRPHRRLPREALRIVGEAVAFYTEHEAHLRGAPLTEESEEV